jgi:hypothetical protein
MTGEVVGLFHRLLLLTEIGLVRDPYAILQRGAGAPIKFRETADVEQLRGINR